MARTKLSKQLSDTDIANLLVAAEALHKSITRPLLSPSSDHYRSLQRTHEALLRTVKEITGKDAAFIQWYTTGPVRPPAAE